MKLRTFQINAFATRAFSGNPAAVVPLPHWIDDDLMQRIAAESRMITAFLVGDAGRYELRWFTPATEIQGICGHGTLAAAFVAATELGDSSKSLTFQVGEGELRVTRAEDDGYILDLPALIPKPIAIDDSLAGAFSGKAEAVFLALDVVAMLASSKEVLAFQPDHDSLMAIPGRGAMITAPGDGEVDFVSRWFGPKQGTSEDTGFTGSAHCSLVPLWASRLGKTSLRARQPSPRGATIDCELRDGRVWLHCAAVKYLEGHIQL